MNWLDRMIGQYQQLACERRASGMAAAKKNGVEKRLQIYRGVEISPRDSLSRIISGTSV
jgi:hypothetical protein